MGTKSNRLGVSALMYAVFPKERFMRFKASFSLYGRKVGGGKVVFYYQCYDANGRRLCGHSTGQTTKTAAREHCIRLFKENKLIRGKYQGIPTFKEFAADFWDIEKSGYLDSIRSRKKISRSYPDMGKMKTVNHLIPEFGALRLDAITDIMIDTWLLSFIKKGYSPATGNSCFKFLSVMLGWAVHEKLITENPCKKVKFLLQKKKKRELLGADDIKKLFGDGWEIYWGKYIYCLINKLAACSGMRIGELLGLKGEFVTPKGITVNGQYTKYGYQDTKNHKTRFTPLTSKVIEELEELKKQTGNGYLFSLDGGNTPVSQSAVTDSLKNALKMLGIDRAEQKRRGLSFHSWRHFANTRLRLADVPIVKIHEAIGHLSMDMTENYTQINKADLDEITTVQERLLTAPKGKKATKKKAV